MSQAIGWWLILLIVGAATLPLCLATFRRLPDHGYSLTKPFALITLGFTFWFLNSLHVLPNERGGIIAALLLLMIVSGAFLWRDREDLRAWIERDWQYAFYVEVAFFLVFLLAVWLRSFTGTIEFTEQPMDLMFVNAAATADYFPPKDPWLSGETVAYYYFGYVIVAMLSTLTGIATEVAYNLGLAMIAAMTLLAAFGIVYNLIGFGRDGDVPEGDDGDLPRFNWRPVIFGVAGALFVAVLGNLVFLLRFASAYGIGGSGFYDWIDVQGLGADEKRDGWFPSDVPFDILDGTRVYPLTATDYVITEFPMFSFVLGDLHPHVMSLPFVLLAVGLALTLYRSEEPLDITFLLRRPALALVGAIILGGLGFINTWDIATFAFVLGMTALIMNGLRAFRLDAAATDVDRGPYPYEALEIVAVIHVALTAVLIAFLQPSAMLAAGLIGLNVVWIALWAAYLTRAQWHPAIEAAIGTVSFILPLAMLAVALYLPFYTSFSSQADGLLPVVTRDGVTVPGTRPISALLVWGPLFALVVPFVIVRLAAMSDRITRQLVTIAAAVPAVIVAGWVLLFGFHKWRDHEDLATAGSLFAQVGDRGVGWVTAILLGALLAATLLAFWLELTSDDDDGDRWSVLFALGLAATAFLLIFGTEFYYIGDLFSSRMNTVFKLYYQAWVLLALAGGVALYILAARWRYTFRNADEVRYGWAGLVVVMLLAGALYPLGATFNRTEGFERDGDLHGLHRYSAGDRQAVNWLSGLAQGQTVTIVEAMKDDYWVTGNWARISAATGVPTVVGWIGHENQWRGQGSTAQLGRPEDVQAIYTTTDEAVFAELIKKYGITYIYVGELERTTYGAAGLEKFLALPVAFQSDDGSVVVYDARGIAAEASSAP
jgi:YYY domain-containing protein